MRSEAGRLAASAVEFDEAFFGGVHDGGDHLAEAGSSWRRITLAWPRMGKPVPRAVSKRRAGWSFSQPRLTMSGCAAEVGVEGDVLEGADRDGGVGRVDGDAAAVGVGDGDHVIDVGEAREEFGADAAGRRSRRWGRRIGRWW